MALSCVNTVLTSAVNSSLGKQLDEGVKSNIELGETRPEKNATPELFNKCLYCANFDLSGRVYVSPGVLNIWMKLSEEATLSLGCTFVPFGVLKKTWKCHLTYTQS
ncbi:MAG: hypothetical protein K0U24_00900 [Gammaproteobacteria bacterium]|nr:hypothetical protein [Gammaproteobacteria bacterium]